MAKPIKPIKPIDEELRAARHEIAAQDAALDGYRQVLDEVEVMKLRWQIAAVIEAVALVTVALILVFQ